MYKNGLYWFTNDLRLEDNTSLWLASRSVTTLLCVYTVDPAWFNANRYTQGGMAKHRWEFLCESLTALADQLSKRQQRLLVLQQTPVKAISALIIAAGIDAIFCSQNAGPRQRQHWQILREHHSDIDFHEYPTHTLFTEESLPFPIAELPPSFSQFRKQVELLPLDTHLQRIDTLAKPPNHAIVESNSLPLTAKAKTKVFVGGTDAGSRQLAHYFAGRLPSQYKQVRNALDGWDNSTKFSAWLANGSLSPRHILSALKQYEAQIESNESTYWILFELLWREYFQWYAHKINDKLFAFNGIKAEKPLTSFYPERFRRWCSGNTPYPIVNACMKQLNATGYMSNRGRQIVASCFVNELNLDWRFGAAYFEQQLIDYDVAINWGNWQYLAGVGADPRGKRHFDLEKQTRNYDPDGTFIEKWQGNVYTGTLDTNDAADWPMS